MRRSETGIEYHLPLHNYAGPGTHVITRIERGDKPINALDASSMIHDLEYVRDSKRTHADQHMVQNLQRYYGPTFIPQLVNTAFTLDTSLGNKRTQNNQLLYKYLKPKAEKLLNEYQKYIKFDD